MSIAYDVCCLTCNQHTHLGLCSAGHWTFGFASFDVAERARAGEFIIAHHGHDVRIIPDAPDGSAKAEMEIDVEAYKHYAAHKIKVREPAPGRLMAWTQHEPAAGLGSSILEAVGNYALHHKLVEIEQAMPPELLVSKYRVNPAVNAAKIELMGKE